MAGYSVSTVKRRLLEEFIIVMFTDNAVSETSVTIYQPTGSGIPKDSGLLQDLSEILKYRILSGTILVTFCSGIRLILCEDVRWIQMAQDRVK